MKLRKQIEHTNAANMSAVWKHLKLSERERRRHQYKHETPTARGLFSAASHVYDEKRKGGLLLVTVMIEMASND